MGRTTGKIDEKKLRSWRRLVRCALPGVLVNPGESTVSSSVFPQVVQAEEGGTVRHRAQRRGPDRGVLDVVSMKSGGLINHRLRYETFDQTLDVPQRFADFT